MLTDASTNTDTSNFSGSLKTSPVQEIEKTNIKDSVLNESVPKNYRNLKIGLTFVAAILPALIFAAGAGWPTGSDAGSSVAARPPSAAFMWAWIIVVVFIITAWCLCIWYKTQSKSWVTDVALVTASGSVFSIVACVWLLVYSKVGVVEASWTLGFAVLAALWFTVSCSRTNPVSASCSVVPLAWCVFALMLNVLEAQTLVTVE